MRTAASSMMMHAVPTPLCQVIVSVLVGFQSLNSF
jgi:hypothetical protein